MTTTDLNGRWSDREGESLLLGRRGREARRGGLSRFSGAALRVAAAAAPAISVAQETSELITTQLPFPSYVQIEDDHYGLRIGQLQVRYDVSVEGIFTDNRNYTHSDQESDFGLRPTLTLGMFYPLNERQKIQVDVGLGYQWWANNSEQNRFYISPSSHLSYTLGVGMWDLLLSNTTSSSSEASSRPEFAGGDSAPAEDVAFNRISNITGVSANWKPGRMGFGARYAFGFDRSLNEQFKSLDQNRHDFSGSVNYDINPVMVVGLGGSYSFFTYSEEVQNDGSSFSVGPTFNWQVRDNITLDVSLGYGESNYDQTGEIQDDDNFAGPTFQVGVTHRINRYLNHSLRVGRNPDTGFGSNFTDRFTIGYNLSAQVGPKITPSLGFSYETASQSGQDGEDADLYHVTLGMGYPILRRATLGFTYGLNIRSADTEERGYVENRISLVLSYRF